MRVEKFFVVLSFYLVFTMLNTKLALANRQCLEFYSESTQAIDLSLNQGSLNLVSHQGFALKSVWPMFFSMQKKQVISLFSADRSIEVQLLHNRETQFSYKNANEIGTFFLNTVQKILQQYSQVGVTFPKTMSGPEVNAFANSQFKKIFAKKQKRWRIAIDLEANEPNYNANIFGKKISFNSFSYESLKKPETLKIIEWMIRHEMGHTKMEQLVGKDNFYVHFKALNEGVADFFSWLGSDDKLFTIDLLKKIRGDDVNYEEALKNISSRDIHKAGAFVTRQLIAIYELWIDSGRSKSEFANAFESFLLRIKPVIGNYGRYFHLWYFSSALSEYFNQSLGLPIDKLRLIEEELKVTQPVVFNLFGLQLGRTSRLKFPEINLDSSILDTGSSFEKPSQNLSFINNPKEWANGHIFERTHNKFWLTENGDLYVVKVDLLNQTQSTYKAQFTLEKILAIEKSMDQTDSNISPSLEPLAMDLAVDVTSGAIHYKILNISSLANPVLSDFKKNYLIWFLDGVGGTAIPDPIESIKK